jgi:hypothetical protein
MDPSKPSDSPQADASGRVRTSPHTTPTRTLRLAYLEWVEEQVAEFKDAIPRGRLLAIADDVMRELEESRPSHRITEAGLADAMNRHLFRLLKLSSYRQWVEQNSGDVERSAGETGRDDSALPEQNAQYPAIVIAWDPQVIDPDLYAEVVEILGDLTRLAGGRGLSRIRSEDFDVPVVSEVTL